MVFRSPLRGNSPRFPISSFSLETGDIGRVGATSRRRTQGAEGKTPIGAGGGGQKEEGKGRPVQKGRGEKEMRKPGRKRTGLRHGRDMNSWQTKARFILGRATAQRE